MAGSADRAGPLSVCMGKGGSSPSLAPESCASLTRVWLDGMRLGRRLCCSCVRKKEAAWESGRYRWDKVRVGEKATMAKDNEKKTKRKDKRQSDRRQGGARVKRDRATRHRGNSISYGAPYAPRIHRHAYRHCTHT